MALKGHLNCFKTSHNLLIVKILKTEYTVLFNAQ